MACDALPLADVKNPCIGEASEMLVGLALVSALRVIGAGHDRSVSEEIHFDFLDCRNRRFEAWISDVRKKLLLVADFPVPLGIHEPARNQSIEGRRIAIHLGFIPQTLENQDFALAWVGLLRRHRD